MNTRVHPERDWDVRAITQAYLAEHPADDDEPITAEWLESIGFEAPGPDVLAKEDLSVTVPDLWWVYRSKPMIRKHETRGDVRRLCAALGVPIKSDQSRPKENE